MNSLFPCRLSCLLSLALGFMPGLIHGQEKQVSVQFVAFPITADPKPVELLIGKGKSIKVELPSNNLSRSYQVPLMEDWVLGKTVEGPEGKPAFDIYGQARATAGDKQVVLVIRKGVDDSEGLELVSFDSGSKGFGGGKYLFLNGAKVDVAGDVGGTKFALSQNHTPYSPPVLLKSGKSVNIYTSLCSFARGRMPRRFTHRPGASATKHARWSSFATTRTPTACAPTPSGTTCFNV